MFERFTEQAREVVDAARHAAAGLGHHYIGTEHLLLGLLAGAQPGGDEAEASGATADATGAAAASSGGAVRSRGGPAGSGTAAGPVVRVLAGAGFDPGYVRSEIIRRVGRGGGGLGQDEATALQAIGIDLDAVRSKLEDSFGEGVLDQASGVRGGGRLPLTPRAKKVLGLSLQEARRLGHGYLGPEHILLGLLRESDGIAGQILAGRSKLSTLRDQILVELDDAA